MPIDLHLHSTESDGTLTPEELIDIAVDNAIDTVALCDHDTTSGVARFLEYARGKSVHALAGVEISAASFGGECHILGINIPLNNDELNSVLEKYRNSRESRNAGIIKKLQALGIPISHDDVKVYSMGDIAGRLHIARVLVDKGAAGSIDDAFKKFLAKDGTAFVDRLKMDPFEMVSLLHKSGATVVLAHPGLLRMRESELYDFVKSLVECGLDALEIYTPHNTDEQIIMLEKMAESLNILKSGGSDFHGENKSGHKIGFYRDTLYVPECVYDICKVAKSKVITYE